MPSIALSNSASEADFQMSASRIFCEMNYTNRVSTGSEITKEQHPHVEEIVDQFDLVSNRESSF